jgi:hypothetical protein
LQYLDLDQVQVQVLALAVLEKDLASPVLET